MPRLRPVRVLAAVHVRLARGLPWADGDLDRRARGCDGLDSLARQRCLEGVSQPSGAAVGWHARHMYLIRACMRLARALASVSQSQHSTASLTTPHLSFVYIRRRHSTRSTPLEGSSSPCSWKLRGTHCMHSDLRHGAPPHAPTSRATLTDPLPLLQVQPYAAP